MKLPRCVFISTGGTIASRINAQTGLAEPVGSAADLMATVPSARSLAEIEMQTFSTIPSPHIGPDEWIRLHQVVDHALRRDDVAAVLVSHGTATLEETAWFLDLTLKSDKPVVVFGAQRNASEPDSDGPRNLLSAIRIGISPDALGKGVLVTLNQHINAAREATKTHTFDVETFNSGEWGYLGNVTPDKVVFHRTPLRRLHVPLKSSSLPRVDIIPMYAGAEGHLVRASIATGAAGIVVQAVGAGHVNPPMFEAIREAIGNGLVTVITTRIPNGGARACYGFAGAARLLQDAGAIIGGDLSAWKARVLLMLAMQANSGADDIRRLFAA
jgi:L-asparaginase